MSELRRNLINDAYPIPNRLFSTENGDGVFRVKNIKAVACASASDSCFYITPDGRLKAIGGELAGDYGSGYTTLSGGLNHIAALRTDGTVSFVGSDYFGQCTVSSKKWLEVACGYYASAGIDTSGYIWWCGLEPGYTTESEGSFTWSKKGTKKWKHVAVGNTFMVAIDSSDFLWVWGYNRYGLGLGEDINTVDFTQVGTKTWKSIAAYGGIYLAIDSEDVLWYTGDVLGLYGSSSAPIANRNLQKWINNEKVEAVICSNDVTFLFPKNTPIVHVRGYNQNNRLNRIFRLKRPYKSFAATNQCLWAVGG